MIRAEDGGGAARPSAKLVAAYAGAPKGMRYEAWREDLCRSFCRIDVEPCDTGKIDCRVEIEQLGSLTLAAPKGSSAQFARTAPLLSDACDDLVLLVSLSGQTFATQRGRPFLLMPLQMYLSEMSAECSARLADGSHFAAIRIPRSELLSICPTAEARLSRAIVDNEPLRETIARYYAFAADAAVRLDPIAQRLVAQHMIDLVALLLGTGPEETELATRRGYSAARLHAIEADIVDHLADGDLTIDSIAQRRGLSPKQIQRTFERNGKTFTEFVREQRLLRATRLLASPGNRGKKIAEIAFDAGFGDLSYFNRAFRERFGTTPSEWRTEPRDLAMQ
jgi:AraC-like DNA-binding protein